MTRVGALGLGLRQPKRVMFLGHLGGTSPERLLQLPPNLEHSLLPGPGQAWLE